MLSYLSAVWRDVLLAARTSARQPSLSLAVVATIGLGIGATSAVLGVVRAALLDPLPYEDAGSLVQVGEAASGSRQPGRTSFPTLQDWREDSRAFSALEAYEGTNVVARIGDDSEMIRGWRVTSGFFALLGVSPSSGRTWADADIGDAGEVVISRRLASRLGGDAAALATPLVVNGSPLAVIGVLPPGFHFGDDADLWMPLLPNAGQLGNRGNRFVNVIGRLREGVDATSAQLALDRISVALAAEYPADMRNQSALLAPLRETLLGNVKPILVTLLAAVAVLLVITVANLGALMLLRNLNRRNELALRAALGASRGRLAAQLFAEGIVLAAAGALAGLYIGMLGVRLMTGMIPDGIKAGMPYLADIRLDLPAVAAVFAIAVVMACAFSLWPAWRAVRSEAPLGQGTRLTQGRGDRQLRRTLVAAQLGLTVVLLIGAAQLAGSLRNLMGREIGVRNPDQLLTLNIALAGPAYPNDASVQNFYEELLRRVEARPEVIAASAVNELPLSGSGVTSLETVDQPTPPSQRAPVALRILAGDYFSTVGVGLREGRLVGSVDRSDTQPSVVVSASLAERLRNDGPVLGRRIRLTRTADTQWEVVGVVDDVHMGKLDVPSPPTVYVHHLQAAENRMPLVVRTSEPTGEMVAAIRAIVRSIDPGVPVYSAATLGRQMRESGAVFTRRFPLVISAVFAGAALLLALVGFYSVSAHEVMSRGRELSVRQVLGATPAAVRAMLLRDGLVLALLGVCGGALVAAPASQIVQSLLFGVRPVEPLLYAGVTVGVLVVSVLAMARPVWRGAATELAAALRS